jgi:paraquat-inducible protein A
VSRSDGSGRSDSVSAKSSNHLVWTPPSPQAQSAKPIVSTFGGCFPLAGEEVVVPSLAARHPRLTLALTLAWSATVALLLFGLTLPAIRIVRLRLFSGDHSIVGSVGLLADGGQWFLAAVIGLFSVVVPAVKLGLLAWLWFAGGGAQGHAGRVVRAIDAHGKWSMLDVLVVAVLVVTLQGGFWVRAEPRPGLWLFAAATFFTMLLSGLVRRLAHRP